jgi:hypothetical protein
MLEAYESALKPAKLQSGEMTCFCRQQFYQNIRGFSSIDFNAFRKKLAASSGNGASSSTGSQATTGTTGGA